MTAAENALRCPMCYTPYINPAVRGDLSRRELEWLREGKALNRMCLSCHGVFRVFMGAEFVSIEGFDGTSNHWVMPTRNDGNGSQVMRPAKRFWMRRIDSLVKKEARRLRQLGYTTGEIARTLRISARKAKKCLDRSK